MRLTDLSLVDNNISVLPDSLGESSMYIMLDRNPLDRIPENFGSLEELDYLTVQYTNISTLPQWLQADGVSINFRARGTPYCLNLPPNSTEAAFAWCAKDDYSNGIFPLAMRDRERAIQTGN
ncbi:serine/threonine protein kinase [Phytophthora cinnamomi]|uniref:serine/threonine protein kinase n=1 Tax=Phytophthora cinnamomi TaxID=4785 RepID=UPI00355A242D|nr:serine/threonine protein kinase [Phytophthora cinnamomi]